MGPGAYMSIGITASVGSLDNTFKRALQYIKQRVIMMSTFPFANETSVIHRQKS
jgi:hypothetical protein